MLKRTKIGLLHAFHVQFEGLQLSSAFFDVGHRGEAVRIANAIFILLGPAIKNHKCIVEQLGWADEIKISSTVGSNQQGGSPLIAVRATPHVSESAVQDGWIIRCVPYGHETLNTAPRLSLTDWWNEGVLTGSGTIKTLSRLQVIRLVRDQDGGAHLDDHIDDPTYVAVHLNGVGFRYKPTAQSEQSLPVEGAAEATIRQMAYEVIDGLESKVISARLELQHAHSQERPINTQFWKEE